jgi:hypothetical protein
MAKVRFLREGDIPKIGTKQLIRQRYAKYFLITFWVVQTLCTIGYVAFSLK